MPNFMPFRMWQYVARNASAFFFEVLTVYAKKESSSNPTHVSVVESGATVPG